MYRTVFRPVFVIITLILLVVLTSACLKDGENTLVLPNHQEGSTNRTIAHQGQLIVPEPKIELALWDHQAIDYDIVSVYINNELVVDHQLLDGPKNKHVVLHILPQTENVLMLFAHNVGAQPPNTVALSIRSGPFYEERSIQTDLNTNGALTLTVQRPNK